MYTVKEVLLRAGVKHERYLKWPAGTLFLTHANQLVGTYSDLRRFQISDRNYFGWHAHHIVESQDLERLGINQHLPPREQQICVLLPERAHIGRVNSVLRVQNPINVSVTPSYLHRAYRDAYALIGNYCGGGEAQIKHELVAIVEAIFLTSGLEW
jgi:hypothetical protein